MCCNESCHVLLMNFMTLRSRMSIWLRNWLVMQEHHFILYKTCRDIDNLLKNSEDIDILLLR